jgi:serine/threonine-protein kinase
MTGAGVILGTAAYMSPEQAKGREADARSDVWAFGAVLYEMLTGRRPFEGEDVSDTMASVLKSEPDWTRLPGGVPRPLHILMRRCLAKERARRPSGMAAVAYVFDALEDADASLLTEPPQPSVVRATSRWTIAAAAVLSVAIAAGAVWLLRPSPATPTIARFSFPLPSGQAFVGGGTRQLLAIAPDGSRVAYVANSRLYVREMNEPEPREIQGTHSEGGIVSPAFAPDGESIAYIEVEGASLKRIPISGGASETVANLAVPCGVSWGMNGILVAARQRNGPQGVWRVAAAGGTPELVIPVASGEEACGPQMLPDGRTVLFTLASDVGDNRWDDAKLVAQSVGGGGRRVLVEGGSDGRYLTSGHLLYAVAGTIHAVPFDAASLAVNGKPVPVVEGVRRSTGQVTSATHLAVSDTGTLAYIPGPATNAATLYGLTIGDDRGESTRLAVPPASYDHPRVSADGGRLAMSRSDEGTASDIWLYDLSRRSEPRRVTFGGTSRYPIWSPDGQRITFQSSRERDSAIWWQSVEGGTPERLTTPADGESHVPESWSPDGRHLLFTVAKRSTWPVVPNSCSCSLWVRNQADGRTTRFTEASSTNLFQASFSRDGKWIAYSVSDGGRPDSPNRGVFVETFPATGVRRQAPRTTGRDYHAAWARDGSRLFYVPDGSRPFVSVSVTANPDFAFGPPTALPSLSPALQGWRPRGYDVLPDGRFVSLTMDTGANEVRVVLNWLEELKRRVPVN